MDYIIFRKKAKEFMRWDSGDIFLTGDHSEIIREQRIEKNREKSEPMVIRIEYVSIDAGNSTANIYYGRKKIGFFIYDEPIDCYDYAEDFYRKLDKWAEEYSTKF